MAKENKIPKGIRIAASLDRKIERVAEHAGTTYTAALEWLCDAGYRYYVEQHPDAIEGIGGKIPRLENMPKLK